MNKHILMKKRYKDHQELVISPRSLMSSTSYVSFFSSGSPPRKIKGLNDLHEVTSPIDDVLTLYYNFCTCEPIMLEEVIKDEK